MIPQSVSLVPLAVIVILAVGALAYAAFKAGSGAARNEPGSRARTVGFSIAGAALLIALGGIAMLVNIMLGHESTYEAIVWSSLNEHYGIVPADDLRGFHPGVPFEALLNGEEAACTVLPPDSVSCDGETILPLTSAGR